MGAFKMWIATKNFLQKNICEQGEALRNRFLWNVSEEKTTLGQEPISIVLFTLKVATKSSAPLIIDP